MNMPIIFRPHRGSLFAAMSERALFVNEKQMLRHVSAVYGYDLFSLYIESDVYSKLDSRIGWRDVRLVMCRECDSEGVFRSYPIGWCSTDFDSFDWHGGSDYE